MAAAIIPVLAHELNVEAVFNPATQGEKFDPVGRYVRRWVPEIAELPDKYLHKPWTAPPSALDNAGVALGRDYPEPIVDHIEARQRALAAFESFREGREGRR